MKLRLAIVVLVLSVAAFAADVQHVTIASRDVAVWKPAGDAPKHGFPVVVFSHGFTGCNTQSRFLMDALSRAGYLVVAPNHADARCGTARRARGDRKPQQPFRDDAAWSDATYRDRRDDMEAVLDAVLRDKTFEGVPVDRDRVGLAGHSLGGYTVLGLAGAWPSWKDKRVKAVLALSPYVNPYVAKGDFKHMSAAVMYQGGTRDFGISPTVKKFDGAYDQSPSPKYYVELDGAGHFAWTDLNPRFQQTIDDYSIAFFDAYLKNSADPLKRLTSPPKPQQVSFVRGRAE